jgi:hypothetical protein
LAKKSNSTLILVAIVVVVLVLGSGMALPKFDLSKFNLFGGGGSGLVDVQKKIEFSLINEYAGSPLTSKTLYVYDSDGSTLLETLTTDGTTGIATTNTKYDSGKVVYVKYVNSNDKQWFEIVVPQMQEGEIQTATTNPVQLKSFAIGTYTDLLYNGATAINDAGNYNQTATGSTSPTFSYTVSNTGSDNTGMKASYDPIYLQDWSVVMYVTFSGTNYETITINGFSQDWTMGTTHYVATTLDPYALTKYKVGNTYKSTGNSGFTFSLDLSGYTGDGVTMQIEVKAYASSAYAQAHGGNFGVSAVELCEQTVLLYQGD